MGLGEITNFIPFWAASADAAKLGRIRASKSGGWGGSEDPRAARTIAPRRVLCWGREIWGIWGEFLPQKVKAIGICVENPLWPEQQVM